MQQNIPEVFAEIAKNQAARAEIQSYKIVTMADASAFKALKDDMDKSLRPAAQAILRRPGGRKGRGNSA